MAYFIFVWVYSIVVWLLFLAQSYLDNRRDIPIEIMIWELTDEHLLVWTLKFRTKQRAKIFFVGMGFRPMTDIESTTIRVYNDTISQNATISSLRNYRISKKKGCFSFVFEKNCLIYSVSDTIWYDIFTRLQSNRTGIWIARQSIMSIFMVRYCD